MSYDPQPLDWMEVTEARLRDHLVAAGVKVRLDPDGDFAPAWAVRLMRILDHAFGYDDCEPYRQREAMREVTQNRDLGAAFQSAFDLGGDFAVRELAMSLWTKPA